jgi:NitT/TauT family transport system substrate-binding protein
MLARFCDDERVRAVFPEVDFEIWPDGKTMREDVLAGRADLAVIPTNVAAGFFNNGVKLRLLAVTVWGILHVLTRGENISTWADLASARIGVPLKGNMPDTIFSTLAPKHGLDLGAADVTYVDSYGAAKDGLIAGDFDVVVLPEPVASAGVEEGAVLTPPVRRLFDLQAEWAVAMGGAPRFPQAGAIIAGTLLDQSPEVLKSLTDALRDANNWLGQQSDDAGVRGETLLGSPKASVIATSLKNGIWETIGAKDARPELIGFYNALMAKSPDLVKGGLPDDAFYVATG